MKKKEIVHLCFRGGTLKIQHSTHGYRNSITDPAQRTKSVKINLNLKEEEKLYQTKCHMSGVKCQV